MSSAYLSEVIVLLNRVIFLRKVLRVLRLLNRIISERFLNDSLANLREAHILIDFSHLAREIFLLSV